MNKCVRFCVLLIALVGIMNPLFAATYFFHTNNGSWQTAGNWSPNRNTLRTDDILIFNTSSTGNHTVTVSTIPSQTIGQLQIVNGCTVSFQPQESPGTNTRTVQINTTGISSLIVAAGSQLIMDNSTGPGANDILEFRLFSNSTGFISGDLVFNSTRAYAFSAATSQGIHFTNGATFQYTSFGNNNNDPFSGGNASGISFDSGATYYMGGDKTGRNGNTGDAFNGAVYQAGSLIYSWDNSNNTFSGETVGNIIFDDQGSGGETIGGANLFVILGQCTVKGSSASVETINGNPGQIQVNGDFIVESGSAGIVDNPAGGTNSSFEVKGHFIANGLFTPAPSTNNRRIYVFDGTSQQTVKFYSSSTAIQSATFNNSNGFILNSPLVVTSTLNMTNGNISTATYLTMGTGTTASTAGILNRTSGTIIGKLVRWFQQGTAGSKIFPVGTASSFNEITVNFTTAPTIAGCLTTFFTPSNPGNTGLPLMDGTDNLQYIIPQGFWTIQTGGSSFSGSVYTLTAEANGFSLPSPVDRARIVKRSNGASPWTLNGNIGTNSGTAIQRTSMSVFSDFGIAAVGVVAGFSASPTNGFGALTVFFTDASLYSPTSWTWDFGDGNTSTDTSPLHIFGVVSAPTSYQVTLIVSDGLSYSTSTQYISLTEPPPIASFLSDTNSGNGPLTINFTDNSVYPTISNTTSWAWDFGDGNTATIQNPQHVYSTVTVPTSYTVSLIVTSPFGVNTTTQVNYISIMEPPPIASFFATPTSGEGPLTINFTDSTLNIPTFWVWDFGDGSTSNIQNPSHTYGYVTVTTNYSIQLIATNAFGSNTASLINYISEYPTHLSAGFFGIPTSGGGPLTVHFVDTSYYNPTSWAWDFGDGGFTTAQNPTHIYNPLSTPTSFTISLIVSNPYATSTMIQYNYVSIASTLPLPVFSSGLPNLKMFVGQTFSPAFDMADFNTGDIATSYSIITNFLSLATNSGSTVSQLNYGSATSGVNSFEVNNINGPVVTHNTVKYSTYKIAKMPLIALRPGETKSIHMAVFTSDSTGATPTIAPSFGNPSSIQVSDTTQLSAIWTDSSTLLLSTFTGFISPVNIDIIASPNLGGGDIDKERCSVYPVISTTGFDMNNISDLSLFSYQIPSGASSLPTITRLTTASDAAGNPSKDGVLAVFFTAPNNGVKMTPTFNAWMPNNPNTWYILRARVYGTSTGINYLQVLYNGVPGNTPTDVQGYFRFAIPTTWSEFDIPINSYSLVSSGNVMYPQLVLRANGSLGSVYIDDIRIFQATPSIIANPRYPTADKYPGGYWNDTTALSSWVIQNAGTISQPVLTVTSSALYVFTNPTTIQSGVKLTAISSSTSIYIKQVIPGRQAGMHMSTQLFSGSSSDSISDLVQINMLGAAGSSGLSAYAIANDIGAAAEIGRISNRVLRLVFTANNPYYQVQFLAKGNNGQTIVIDNTQADSDIDDPNYGDVSLFP